MIGTFWFSWIPGAGFMTAAPTDIFSPNNWNDVVTNSGSAIQWTTTSDLLSPGGTISGFLFDSTMTPADFEGTVPSGLGAGDPITTPTVYIAAPLADPGFHFFATPGTTATPEPRTLLSTTIGFVLIAFCGSALRRRRRMPVSSSASANR